MCQKSGIFWSVHANLAVDVAALSWLLFV